MAGEYHDRSEDPSSETERSELRHRLLDRVMAAERRRPMEAPY